MAANGDSRVNGQGGGAGSLLMRALCCGGLAGLLLGLHLGVVALLNRPATGMGQLRLFASDMVRLLYLPALACILVGALTKSAQFPFHFWLPNAMSAPTPVSAFLHSATMVKAGIYLLARLHPVLGGTTAWMGTLVVVGGTTALIGALSAVGRRDLKAMLADTTVMGLGVMTLFLGGQSTPSLTAAMTFLMVHALYKSSLFLVVGTVDHQAGTRDLTDLGGLGARDVFDALVGHSGPRTIAVGVGNIGGVGRQLIDLIEKETT